MWCLTCSPADHLCPALTAQHPSYWHVTGHHPETAEYTMLSMSSQCELGLVDHPTCTGTVITMWAGSGRPPSHPLHVQVCQYILSWAWSTKLHVQICLQELGLADHLTCTGSHYNISYHPTCKGMPLQSHHYRHETTGLFSSHNIIHSTRFSITTTDLVTKLRLY